MHGFLRDPYYGASRRVAIEILPGALFILGSVTTPTRLRRESDVDLVDHGDDDGPAVQWRTDAGERLIIPGRFAAAVERAILSNIDD